MRNPSVSPPLFVVPMPGLKSDANEFSSAVKSLVPKFAASYFGFAFSWARTPSQA